MGHPSDTFPGTRGNLHVQFSDCKIRVPWDAAIEKEQGLETASRPLPAALRERTGPAQSRDARPSPRAHGPLFSAPRKLTCTKSSQNRRPALARPPRRLLQANSWELGRWRKRGESRSVPSHVTANPRQPPAPAVRPAGCPSARASVSSFGDPPNPTRAHALGIWRRWGEGPQPPLVILVRDFLGATRFICVVPLICHNGPKRRVSTVINPTFRTGKLTQSGVTSQEVEGLEGEPHRGDWAAPPPPQRVEHFLSRAGQSPPRRGTKWTEGPSLPGTAYPEPRIGRGWRRRDRSAVTALLAPPSSRGCRGGSSLRIPRTSAPAPGCSAAPSAPPRPSPAIFQPVSGTSSPPRLVKGLLSPLHIATQSVRSPSPASRPPQPPPSFGGSWVQANPESRGPADSSHIRSPGFASAPPSSLPHPHRDCSGRRRGGGQLEWVESP